MENTALLLMYSISAALMDLNTADIFIHQGGCRREEHKEAVILLYPNNLSAWWVAERPEGCISYPCPGSRAMARGCSMPPAISVVRISPLSLATSIWSRLLSIQYSFPVIQSTASPSGVARPCCTTTSIPVTPNTMTYTIAWLCS